MGMCREVAARNAAPGMSMIGERAVKVVTVSVPLRNS